MHQPRQAPSATQRDRDTGIEIPPDQAQIWLKSVQPSADRVLFPIYEGLAWDESFFGLTNPANQSWPAPNVFHLKLWIIAFREEQTISIRLDRPMACSISIGPS